MKEFQDKVVIITGSSHGIGLCMAEKFGKNGAIVCGIDLSEKTFFQGDVGSRETLERFAQKVIEAYGRMDVLINNAPPQM